MIYFGVALIHVDAQTDVHGKSNYAVLRLFCERASKQYIA